MQCQLQIIKNDMDVNEHGNISNLILKGHRLCVSSIFRGHSGYLLKHERTNYYKINRNAPTDIIDIGVKRVSG